MPASTSAEVGMFSDLVEGVAKFANSKLFLLRFQPFLFCSKALSTQSTHGGERLVDRKRLMRNPRVWFYRQTRTLDFQIGLFCFGSGPERVGCKNRKPGRIDTDRAATGAGQFVLSGKNGRHPGSGPSDLHYGKNCYDGGPVRVIPARARGRGAERVADRATGLCASVMPLSLLGVSRSSS